MSRLTEAELREIRQRDGAWSGADPDGIPLVAGQRADDRRKLIAELDAVRAERDEARQRYEELCWIHGLAAEPWDAHGGPSKGA